MMADFQAASYRVEVRGEGDAWDAIGHGVGFCTAESMLAHEQKHGREARAVDLATAEVLPELSCAPVMRLRVAPPTFSHDETIELWHALSQYLENDETDGSVGRGRSVAEAALGKLDAYVATLAEAAS